MSIFSRFTTARNADCESPHDQGRSAFAAGQSDEACPYLASSPASNKRTKWMSGYYGERVRRVLERLEAKHGSE